MLETQTITDVHPLRSTHSDSQDQRLEADNLGLWLFIGAEALFFSGLFCAYLALRQARPEVFAWGSFYLDVPVGALNTGILITSSCTAALAVRAAQQGNKPKLMAYMILTLLLGGAFLGVKSAEYHHKYHSGLLPGARFNPAQAVWERRSFERRYPQAARYARQLRQQRGGGPGGPPIEGRALPVERSGLSLQQIQRPLLEVGAIGPASEYGRYPTLPRNAHQFFGIYFSLTATHALHVMAGMAAWLWLLARLATAGAMPKAHVGAIHCTALYWHLVDLIWIYLFPLLYLVN